MSETVDGPVVDERTLDVCAHDTQETEMCSKCERAGEECRWNEGGECWCEAV